MNAKHLTALAALAAISIAVTAWVLHAGAPTISSDRRGESVVPSLIAKANDITGLSIRDSTGTLVIERRDNRFVESDSGYPVKTEAVSDLVASTASLAFQEARTRDPARYGDLGLADPGDKDGGKEITLRTAAGELADFVVGNRDFSVGGPAGGTFIRLKGDPQTFLVRGDVRLPTGASDWLVALDLDVKRNEIKKVELTGGGREGVTASADPGKPGDLVLARVPEKRSPDTFKVSRLSSLVESFTFQDVRKATKPAEDARRMTVDTSEGLRLVLTSVDDLTKGWVQITAEATNDATKDKAKLIASKVEGYAFRVPSSQAEIFGWTIMDLTDEQKS
jgi:hypothetical protein